MTCENEPLPVYACNPSVVFWFTMRNTPLKTVYDGITYCDPLRVARLVHVCEESLQVQAPAVPMASVFCTFDTL